VVPQRLINKNLHGHSGLMPSLACGLLSNTPCYIPIRDFVSLWTGFLNLLMDHHAKQNTLVSSFFLKCLFVVYLKRSKFLVTLI
jgi:hypothetical protein